MNPQRPRHMLEEINRLAAELGQARLMEVCGTHTVTLFRSGLRSMLPPQVELISGPGCPVCVTSQGYIDAACRLAAHQDVMTCTYGDMVSVPGNVASLETQRAAGAQVKVVYSARDAVRLAVRHPDRKVVFLAVGFETTAPATAAALLEADHLQLRNFFVLTAHKLVVPAMETLLRGGDVPLDGFLCPGHVSVIIGADAYRPIVEQYHKPCVVVGFEPPQMLEGILAILRQLSAGETKLENVYAVAVNESGNTVARRIMERVFRIAPATWRAMGELPDSGLELANEFERYDARVHFGLTIGPDHDPPACRCGEVIQGKAKPIECVLFGDKCTPTLPVGPCMVSSEGTCAAWYKYHREPTPASRPMTTVE